MKLTDLMHEKLIFPRLLGATKADALRELVKGLIQVYSDFEEDEVFRVIMEREKLSSTGIGSGIAIPHAKWLQCKNHIALFGRSRQGIPFDSIDGKPVHLIFMILGPIGGNEGHLKALARISKFLHDTTFRDRLLTAENASEVMQAIREKDERY